MSGGDFAELSSAQGPPRPQVVLVRQFYVSRGHYEYDASSVSIDPEPRCPGKLCRDSFLPHNSSSPRRRRRQIVVGDGAGAAPTNSDPNSRQTRAKTDPVGPRWRLENPLLGSAPAGQSQYRHYLSHPQNFRLGRRSNTMTHPDPTPEELRIVRAKRARLGASDHPLDERRAVMRLRLANKLKERDAYLAAYAVYTAQQAEAARFWQQQQLLQRQHALAAAAREVLAARQRAADAQRAAEQRAIDADARNAAAAAAAAREVLRADAAAWAAIELARAHERIRQLSAQQESVTASPACRGSSASERCGLAPRHGQPCGRSGPGHWARHPDARAGGTPWVHF